MALKEPVTGPAELRKVICCPKLSAEPGRGRSERVPPNVVAPLTLIWELEDAPTGITKPEELVRRRLPLMAMVPIEEALPGMRVPVLARLPLMVPAPLMVPLLATAPLMERPFMTICPELTTALLMTPLPLMSPLLLTPKP